MFKKPFANEVLVETLRRDCVDHKERKRLLTYSACEAALSVSPVRRCRPDPARRHLLARPDF